MRVGGVFIVELWHWPPCARQQAGRVLSEEEEEVVGGRWGGEARRLVVCVRVCVFVSERQRQKRASAEPRAGRKPIPSVSACGCGEAASV